MSAAHSGLARRCNGRAQLNVSHWLNGVRTIGGSLMVIAGLPEMHRGSKPEVRAQFSERYSIQLYSVSAMAVCPMMRSLLEIES